MNRKEFLLTGLAAIPAIALAKNAKSSAKKRSTTKPFVVDAGKARYGDGYLFNRVNHNDVKVSSKDTSGQLSVFEYTGVEKIGPLLHVHYQQDEVFTITEGEFRFVVGEETHMLKTGQTIFLPRNIPHTWIQLSDTGKLIYFFQPAGKMEEFFFTMNSLTQMPTPEEMQRIHREHEMGVVGPPLSL